MARIKKQTLKKNAWVALKPGDIIDIVAPASGSSRAEFNAALNFVRSFGLEPRFPKDIYGKDLLCANSDQKRFQHLKKALFAKDSKAIWCMRGGYGSLRLLPQLNRLTPPEHCKLFIGYSDITAVHLFLNQQWHWPTLHGTMLEELGRGEGGRRELRDFQNIIYGLVKEVEYSGLSPLNARARKSQTMTGKVVGGNLAILGSSLGTPWQFNARGKFLVLEDIGERGYRVDRMLVHLEQAGIFKGVRALVFGDFVGGEENRDEDCVYMWKDVQKRFAQEAKFPVFKGLPFGHGAFQRPIPFLSPAYLKIGPRSSQLRVKIP